MPYPGLVTLFKPRVNYKFYPDPNMGWRDLALGGLDLVEVAVTPHSMLLEPYVSVLAAQLKERIAGASAVPDDSEGDDASPVENEGLSASQTGSCHMTGSKQ